MKTKKKRTLFNSKKILLILLSAAWLLTGCFSNDTSNVTISLGLNQNTQAKSEPALIDKILRFFSTEAAAEAPTDISQFFIKISGPNMPTVNYTYPPGVGSVTISVSAGANRHFEVRAPSTNGTEIYYGSATANLTPGEEKTLAIAMGLSAGYTFSITSDPNATTWDVPYSIAVDGDYMFVAGDAQNGGGTGRIEKYNKNTGVPEPAFDGDGAVDWSAPNTNIYSIAVDSSYIYSTGRNSSYNWLVEKRNKTTGAIDTSFGTSGLYTYSVADRNYPWSIALETDYLYITGQRWLSTNSWLQTHKLNKTGNSAALPESAFGTSGIKSSPSATGTSNSANSLALDADSIYIAGSNFGTSIGWRIEKFNKATGTNDATFGTSGVISIDPSSDTDAATAIQVDDNYVYVAGYDCVNSSDNEQWRIAKFNKTTGNLVISFGNNGTIVSNPGTWGDRINAMAIDSKYIYCAGYQLISGEADSIWRIEKRDISTGELVSTFGTGGAVTQYFGNNMDQVKTIVVDSYYIYLAGVDTSPSSGTYWRIQKRLKSTGGF
ncbi:MAG: hypothetical protein GY754_04615 [bacterium]|nr:hypothetical protein [bacterium]